MVRNPTPAKYLINKFYYLLPNNGYLNEGLLSCDRRYKEAIDCAIACVDEVIEALEHHSWVNYKIVSDYEEIKKELIQIQNDNWSTT